MMSVFYEFIKYFNQIIRLEFCKLIKVQTLSRNCACAFEPVMHLTNYKRYQPTNETDRKLKLTLLSNQANFDGKCDSTAARSR